MCNLYRGTGYIPSNRPELYEKCSVMLFERWDKDRGIEVPFEKYLRPAMMTIAQWIFSNQDLQTGVSEQLLIAKAADYLEPYHATRDEAETVAKSFVEYCRGRAWVFTDVGDGIYQFTHRTFLEYFTAYHLTRTHHSPQELVELLAPKIAAGEWDVVAQLAIQIKENNTAGAVDVSVDNLLGMLAKTGESERINILSFLARLLRFAVPSYKLRLSIINTLVTDIFQGVTSYKPTNPSIDAMSKRISIVRSLNRVHVENRNSISEGLHESLSDMFSNERMRSDARLLKRSVSFVLAVGQLLGDSFEPANDFDIFKVGKSIATVDRSFGRPSASDLYELGLLDSNELLMFGGLNAIFPKREFLDPQVFSINSLLSRIFRYLSGEEFRPIYSQLLTELSRLRMDSSDGLALNDTPILGFEILWTDQLSIFRSTKMLLPDQRFGLFIILASLLEIQNETTSKALKLRMRRKEFSNFGLFACVLARYHSEYEQFVEKELADTPLLPAQRSAVKKWVNAEFNLVG